MNDKGRQRSALSHWWRVVLITLPVVAVVAAVTLWVFPASHAGSPVSPHAGLSQGQAPSVPTPICGQPILDSPWHYDGAPGTYTAGNEPAGLPSFGSPRSDFPAATKIIVVPAGNNTSAAGTGVYNVDHAVIYLEPGVHRIENGMYTGHDSAYVGGYDATVGKAVLDGVDGRPGPAYSRPSTGNQVADTWEYLTIENFGTTHQGSLMGGVNGGIPGGSSSDDGDTYKYDTIGPNNWSEDASPPVLNTKSAPGQGGGYAIGLGNYTTIEDNCITGNAQGGFNGQGVGIVISNNEIAWNGLGEYPDSPGPGGSPYACGCGGGGKLFWSVNAKITGNWVHDNYDPGIWLDFDNTGATITGNYIASNWAEGIIYEASYNADISDNTLIGNGWASDGAWPAGVGGKSCYGGVPCPGGAGPESGDGGGNPYAAIYLPNSGGNPNLNTISIPSDVVVPGCSSNCSVNSHYAGSLLVQDNRLVNNFGGVKVYTDTNRWPGNTGDDSACSQPLGSLVQPNSTTYYWQPRELQTGADATISGRAVTSSGTKTICSDFKAPPAHTGGGGDTTYTVHAPVTGMAVYNQNTGAFLGTVASVTSAKRFTLDRSPGNETGAMLLLSAFGGCGPADYYGGRPGAATGQPSADYWDNCIWGSRNVAVKDNVFSIDAGVVRGCETAKNLCGYMENAAFNPGEVRLLQFWDSYQNYIAEASGGLGNVWSDNTYIWSGGGSGGWQFWAAVQGNLVTRSQWQAPPYRQDAGSTFH